MKKAPWAANGELKSFASTCCYFLRVFCTSVWRLLKFHRRGSLYHSPSIVFWFEGRAPWQQQNLKALWQPGQPHIWSQRYQGSPYSGFGDILLNAANVHLTVAYRRRHWILCLNNTKRILVRNECTFIIIRYDSVTLHGSWTTAGLWWNPDSVFNQSYNFSGFHNQLFFAD